MHSPRPLDRRRWWSRQIILGHLGSLYLFATAVADVYLDFAYDRLDRALQSQAVSAPVQRRLLLNGVELEGSTWVDARPIGKIREEAIHVVRSQYEAFYSSELSDDAWADAYLALPRMVLGSAFVALVRTTDFISERASRTSSDSSDPLGPVQITFFMPEGPANESRGWRVEGSLGHIAASFMTAAREDAAGADVPGIPRPPGAQRIMSLVEDFAGRRHYTLLYTSTHSPAAALDSMVGSLSGAGYVLDSTAYRPGKSHVTMTAPGRSVVLFASQDGVSGAGQSQVVVQAVSDSDFHPGAVSGLPGLRGRR